MIPPDPSVFTQLGPLPHARIESIQGTGNYEEARRLYATLDRTAARCNDCQRCVERCPQRLEIPEKLRATHRLLA